MKTLPDFVTCGHCGETWPLTTRPYPLANGICHDCRRHLKKPNYMLAAENQRLKAEVERLTTKLNAACRERDEAYAERFALVGNVAALEAELADERADRKAYYKHYIEAHADANALRKEHT